MNLYKLVIPRDGYRIEITTEDESKIDDWVERVRNGNIGEFQTADKLPRLKGI